MLKSESSEPEQFFPLAPEDEAEIVGAVGIFQTARRLPRPVHDPAKSEYGAEGAVFTDFNGACACGSRHSGNSQKRVLTHTRDVGVVEI